MNNLCLVSSFSESHYDVEFDHLLKGKEIVVQADSLKIDGFTDQLVCYKLHFSIWIVALFLTLYWEIHFISYLILINLHLFLLQKTALLRLSKLPPFKEIEKFIKSNRQEFDQWLKSENATQNIPKCWNADDLSGVGEVMYETLVVQAFRPDNLHAMMRRFVLTVMGVSFLQEAEQEMDMPNVVENQVKKCPLYHRKISRLHFYQIFIIHSFILIYWMCFKINVSLWLWPFGSLINQTNVKT